MIRRHAFTTLAGAALVFGALVQLLQATSVIGLGAQPGEEPQLVGFAYVVGLLGALLAAVAVLIGPRWADALPLLGAAFLVARFESYDAYYAPALRRMSDGGLLSPWWVWFLCAAAVATAVVHRARPVAAALLLLIACSALLAGAGH
jgi:hypothetical protein